MSIHHVCEVPKRAEKDVGAFHTGVGDGVNYHVDTWNENQFLWNTSQCCWQLSLLLNP